MRSRLLTLFVVLAIAAVGAGCSAGEAKHRTVPVTMTDAMVFQPDGLTAKVGETITFEVRNAGALPHEFFVGSAVEQDDHEAEMQQMGSMRHDHPTGIHVDAGAMRSLSISFTKAGTLLIGCHEAGHWLAGMKGTITVTA